MATSTLRAQTTSRPRQWTMQSYCYYSRQSFFYEFWGWLAIYRLVLVCKHRASDHPNSSEIQISRLTTFATIVRNEVGFIYSLNGLILVEVFYHGRMWMSQALIWLLSLLRRREAPTETKSEATFFLAPCRIMAYRWVDSPSLYWASLNVFQTSDYWNT